uniref:Ubiquitin conjugating enzyme E2 L5 n=1 Tax=Molossus molossus TaxID=27622 RepID=A0A7J8J9X1_MOLMO|nr:ubiquitin conjugating enzyme E2 L5 [Molossus molossus]
MKELEEIHKRRVKKFHNPGGEANLLTWQGCIVHDNPPYDKRAFRIKINFPARVPIQTTKDHTENKDLYPNNNEKGKVCLPVISAENWKPGMKTDQVIQSLIALVNDPPTPAPTSG